MKLSLIIALVLFISSFGSATVLFWDNAHKAVNKKITPPSSIEIKWGEGS
jgi:hypothetical protein